MELHRATDMLEAHNVGRIFGATVRHGVVMHLLFCDGSSWVRRNWMDNEAVTIQR